MSFYLKIVAEKSTSVLNVETIILGGNLKNTVNMQVLIYLTMKFC